jgi:hypothetical protein
MSISAKMYSNFPLKAWTALISDLSAASKMKLMLCTSSYTPNQETDTIKSDVTNEVSGTGYVAGGAVLTTPTVSEASRVTTLDADDVEWADSTITARYAVLYDDGATDDPLILYIDFGEDKESVADSFKVVWNALGITYITVPS